MNTHRGIRMSFEDVSAELNREGIGSAEVEGITFILIWGVSTWEKGIWNSAKLKPTFWTWNLWKHFAVVCRWEPTPWNGTRKGAQKSLRVKVGIHLHKEMTLFVLFVGSACFGRFYLLSSLTKEAIPAQQSDPQLLLPVLCVVLETWPASGPELGDCHVFFFVSPIPWPKVKHPIPTPSQSRCPLEGRRKAYKCIAQ